jgi:hypothetical protein
VRGGPEAPWGRVARRPAASQNAHPCSHRPIPACITGLALKGVHPHSPVVRVSARLPAGHPADSGEPRERSAAEGRPRRVAARRGLEGGAGELVQKQHRGLSTRGGPLREGSLGPELGRDERPVYGLLKRPCFVESLVQRPSMAEKESLAGGCGAADAVEERRSDSHSEGGESESLHAPSDSLASLESLDPGESSFVSFTVVYHAASHAPFALLGLSFHPSQSIRWWSTRHTAGTCASM